MKGSTFNQLTVFSAIASEGSIAAAARKLSMTSPSVSHSLKLLEQQLGLPLFSRTTRKIELTEAGQLLRERIAVPMQQLDFALESVQDLSQQPSGRVSITLPRFVYQFFLQPIYAEFCQRYPEIELEISVSDKDVDIVTEGHDLGIRLGDRIAEGMVARQLTAPMQDALFASPDYLRRCGMPQSIDELKQHKLVQYRFLASKQFAPAVLRNDGQPLTLELPTALVVNDTDAVIDAVRKGLGLGKLLTPMVQRYLDNGELVPILPEHWHQLPGLYLYFVQRSQQARRVRVLVDFLIEKGQLS
ncbi:LysR family transcriptional regulator [Ferrimonas senticii]|uniref:LysR family transcriptional regulator n=1 Tax=Ferrimonas senticii TaxID=394566 RepID=UPI000425B8E8|nr:LysR family transcriptional regulator [Ferrimonas senticii]